jgi:hypothetical protein
MRGRLPRQKPLGATSNPIASVLDATENRASVSGITRPNGTSMNDPG